MVCWVQAYFCGHDHHLEHLHTPNSRLHYIISGAGSEVLALPPASLFMRNGNYCLDADAVLPRQAGSKSQYCDPSHLLIIQHL